jgi:predicted dehydrogenase
MPNISRKIMLLSGAGKVVRRRSENAPSPAVAQVRLGVIGGGNFANATLLPAIKNAPSVDLIGIASGMGLSAQSTAERFGFAYCTTNIEEILGDLSINVVAILTRHHLHACQVTAALRAGKHVFVEKPLCLNQEELRAIISTRDAMGRSNNGAGGQTSDLKSPVLMVGFNRRFAPFIVELREHLQHVQEPLMLHYRVNAGFIPLDHWTQDSAQGGGRLLGEACHFVDLLIDLSGSSPQRVTARALPDNGRYSQDNLLITLEFADGSLGTVTYVANGDKGFGKEYLEVFGGGLSARLEDYRTLFIRHGNKSTKRVARLRQDKGHRAEWQSLIAHLTGRGPVPMSFEEIVLSTKATLAAYDSLQRSEPVTLTDEQ